MRLEYAPIVIVLFISFDFVSDSAFPKITPTVLVVFIFATLIWNIARSMFFNPYCGSLKFRWGLYGESISYCTIKRITHFSGFVASKANPGMLVQYKKNVFYFSKFV